MAAHDCGKRAHLPDHALEPKRAAAIEPAGSPALRARRVLLLQGPVGPFFSGLQDALEASGYDVRRVIFNFGDRVFALGRKAVRFDGTPPEWANWLEAELGRHRPDAIILFGCNRPPHRVAREIAAAAGIPVLSLEEGYLRSGYVSCEAGGNNMHSPMARWRPRRAFARPGQGGPAPSSSRFSFAAMCLWGAIYYLLRDLASKPSEEPLFHRDRERIVPLAFNWTAHMLGRIAARLTEFPTRRSLGRAPGYLLIPLQVGSDSQLQLAARGWTTERLIDAVLQAAGRSGTGPRVVFKLHPLEPRSSRVGRMIRRKARQFGVPRRRVTILRSGRMGDLTARSSGMIVINSTSAFSALHHDIPVLVLGEAVFRHREIVTIGENEADVARFLLARRAKSRAQIDAFIAELKAQSLISGGFYGRTERKAAIAGIMGRLEQLQAAVHDMRAAGA
jgi:capsular polysaccharide export protein